MWICLHNSQEVGWFDSLIKSLGRHTWKKNSDQEMRAKIIDWESEGGLAPQTPYSHIYYYNCAQHRVHTEWQWPLSGVHYIMMVKSAQPGEVGGVHGCTPSPFRSIYHHEQSFGVRSSWEGRSTPLFLLYPYLYSVVHSELRQTDRQAGRYRAEHEIERRPEWIMTRLIVCFCQSIFS